MPQAPRKYTKGDTVITKCAIDGGACGCIPARTVGSVQCVNGMMVYCSFDGFGIYIGCSQEEIAYQPSDNSLQVDDIEGFRAGILADLGKRARVEVSDYAKAVTFGDRRYIQGRMKMLQETIDYWQNVKFENRFDIKSY